MTLPGARPAQASELLRVGDRISFLYLEHAIVHRDANAITATSAQGTIHIPAATLGCLLLGPGTRVSHHAMMLLAESGSSVVWVGERGVRYYAHGRGLSRSTHLLESQARLVSSAHTRLGVARAMYAMRFPGEDVTRLTMQQLRGREGARVRRIYREESKRTGVPWSKRDYRPDDFAASDPINQALSAAHTALYGVVHSVIVGLGCAPGLGFVHTGHDRSFVYDVADLYKTETSVPVAFDVAASGVLDVGAHARRAMREYMFDSHLLQQCVHDVQKLLLGEAEAVSQEGQDLWGDVVQLWDGRSGAVAGGINYDTESDGPLFERGAPEPEVEQ